jgi:hypothetical protein
MRKLENPEGGQEEEEKKKQRQLILQLWSLKVYYSEDEV